MISRVSVANGWSIGPMTDRRSRARRQLTASEPASALRLCGHLSARWSAQIEARHGREAVS